MPKVKTKSAAKKRFRKTGGKSLKIKRASAFRRHLLTKKSSKRKKQLRKSTYVNERDMTAIVKLLPY